MATIHPSSVVEPGATLAETAVIGPFCYVGPRVTIGPGTRLVSHVAILGRTTLGEGNTVWPQATLGAAPQDLKYRGEDSELVIGDFNEIRELVTMHLGTGTAGGVTRVGDQNLIMTAVHVAHDCVIGSHTILSSNVGLAGHVHVQDHAILGGAVGVHHFVTFGQYCYVGGMSRIVHDVPPFMIVEGDPGDVRAPNIKGMTRHQFPPASIDIVKQVYRNIFRRQSGESEAAANASLPERLAALERDHPEDECVQIIVRFMRNTLVGVHGRYQESLRADKNAPAPAQ
ncbi:MAG: acyl-ACP--UDP-N-acetylglucosamine O-acyltransferase [Planctomycetes bacterium]|nr:acyl-ACP--UDP-N-acetylglucosamine O-acyltransferase [Planctomycetota bacterium]